MGLNLIHEQGLALLVLDWPALSNLSIPVSSYSENL